MRLIKTSYFAKIRMMCDSTHNYYSVTAVTPSADFDTGKYRNKPVTFLDLFIPDSVYITRPYKLGEIDEDEYERRYLKQLSDIPEEELKSVIDKVFYESGDKTPVFVCWEGTRRFCHRHILADFLNNHLGDILEVKEVTTYW